MVVLQSPRPRPPETVPFLIDLIGFELCDYDHRVYVFSMYSMVQAVRHLRTLLFLECFQGLDSCNAEASFLLTFSWGFFPIKDIAKNLFNPISPLSLQVPQSIEMYLYEHVRES